MERLKMAEESMSFEGALAELEGIVSRLEAGGVPLEEMLALFERGQGLVSFCNQALDQAELQVERLSAPSTDSPDEE
jgi:exodeoxyribonuclease VII small subunit